MVATVVAYYFYEDIKEVSENISAFFMSL